MTRTFKHLYPQIYDPDNLWLAWRAARRGGKRKWPSVASFSRAMQRHLNHARTFQREFLAAQGEKTCPT